MTSLPLDLNIILAITLASVLQSIFGVGVLLFGTPLLLLNGLSLPEILTTLLPISIGISLSQVLRDYRHIDRGFIGKVYLYTIPAIVLFLALALKAGSEFGLLIAGLLFLFAFARVSQGLNRNLDRLVRYERLWLLATGIVHGLTNLGGSLLTMIVHQKRYPKDKARVTIAAAYVSFAGFQLVTLLLLDSGAAERLLAGIHYMGLGILVYLLTNRVLYLKLSAEVYARAFSLFLFCSGILVTLKSLSI